MPLAVGPGGAGEQVPSVLHQLQAGEQRREVGVQRPGDRIRGARGRQQWSQLLLAIAGDTPRAEHLVPSWAGAGPRDLGQGGSQNCEHRLRFEDSG